jgi:oligoendopeptidase F
MSTFLSSSELSPWSLNDLFPASDGPELQAAFQRIEDGSKEFETLRGQLNPEMPAETFLDMLRRMEDLHRLANRVYSYAELLFAADTQNQAAQALLARVERTLAEAGNRTLFFSLWWKELDDAAAERLMQPSGDYRYWLEEMRHFKPHTLTEPEEKIINLKDVTGARALTNLYDAITNRYTFNLEIDGEMKELTRGELMVFARHPDADLRSRAYSELYRVYGDDGPILGQIYQTLVRDWRTENLNLRHFDSPMAVRNLANDIPNDVVNTLLEVSQRNAPLFQRFFQLKARWLGLPTLRRCDIYAPLAASDRNYAYSQAVDMVFDSFNQFDPQFARLAKRVFDQDHLDSEVRKGKRGGAFCLTATPDLTPWVLVNYQGKINDVSTLAHELGHAIHSMLAEGHTSFTQHACLPLAETASTFGEMMLVERLLAEESDEAVRRDILFGQLDDNYATIMRQAFFALFEQEAHEKINQGALVDELCDAYLQNLQRQFGNSVEIEDHFRWEWVSIPHIYQSPFYVYAYAFGQLLVLSLYRQFKLEGEAFKPRYIQLLAAGGSKAPMRVLADAGMDVSQASFWQGGFDVLRGWLEQLEALPLKPSGG